MSENITGDITKETTPAVTPEQIRQMLQRKETIPPNQIATAISEAFKLVLEERAKKPDVTKDDFRQPIQVTLGRDPGQNERKVSPISRIMIDAPETISRKHIDFEFDPETRAFTIIDRSKNGTFLDGERIDQKAVLKPLQSYQIKLGGHEDAPAFRISSSELGLSLFSQVTKLSSILHIKKHGSSIGPAKILDNLPSLDVS